MIENVDYEYVELPSKGECYPHKKGRIAVAYMKAIDENILAFPGYIRTHTVCDELLRHKIIDNDINPDNLCIGDRNAVLVWLRRTGYGDIVISHNDGNKVDLSELKFKEFTLKGDENGYFNYLLGNGDVIKYRLLTHDDEQSIINAINDYLGKDDDESFKRLCDLVLLKSTVSVNGNNSESYCNEYLNRLSEDEWFGYLRSITANTPDYDFSNVVLTIDDSLFNDIE